MNKIIDILNRYFLGVEGHCRWEKVRVVVTLFLIGMLFFLTFTVQDAQRDLWELQKNATDMAWFCLNVFNISTVDPNLYINGTPINYSVNITALYNQD